MKVQQHLWTRSRGWRTTRGGENGRAADAVLVFGAPEALTQERLKEVGDRHPGAQVAACTTGGEIHGRDVIDGTISATALTFERTPVTSAAVDLPESGCSHTAGAELGALLKRDDLKSIIVLSDGTRVNGSALIRELISQVGPQTIITGGLAGDGPRFGQTQVGLAGRLSLGRIVALALHGDAVRTGHGTGGGWDEFGPERHITRAEGNILFELDGQPALDLYKRYLGEEATVLPGSALVFPLRVYPAGLEKEAVVRTVVGIDEDQKAMIFAGDVPRGHRARLMRGHFDRLFFGASSAALQAQLAPKGDLLAVLVSCIGRKLLFGQRTVEEVDAVAETLGPDAAIAGFYSYGEISPISSSGFCELHNQTMTITTICED